MTTALVNDNARKWKFCTKCVCRQSGKNGLYLLSHFDHEHRDNYTPPALANESNLVSVDIPIGIPAATTRDLSVGCFEDDDPIEFQGTWCASVSTAAADAALCVLPTVPAADNKDTAAAHFADDLDVGASIPADLASITRLSSVEREMFLLVEHDLFPGTSAAKQVTQCHSDPVLLSVASPSARREAFSTLTSSLKMCCLDSSFSP